MKENSLHQGSNQGPLACLAEMLTITPSDLVERLRSHQHLYYIFEYCILFFQKPQHVWWPGPVGVAANISANFFFRQFFFRPNFFSPICFWTIFLSIFFSIYSSYFARFFTFYTVFAYSSSRILWFCLKYF